MKRALAHEVMPAVFLGHGSPMNALEKNRFTEAWRAFGEACPRPRAILCVSAHWYVPFTAVTAMARPRTIHDFYGFPQRLFEVQYPAPGDPKLAEEIRDLVDCGLDQDSWGIDHGTWSVLVHAFPKADIPALQLAIDEREDIAFHVELGARLAPLRERGVLVIASGNVVHNLHAIDWKHADHGFDWAQRFDESARTLMRERPGDIAELETHGDYELAVPTPDHFLPLAYVAGLARAAKEPLLPFIEGYAYGSLSMTCFGLAAPPMMTTGGGPSAPLPTPADESNV